MYSQEIKSRSINLLKEGKTYSEIMKATKVPERTLRGWKNEAIDSGELIGEDIQSAKEQARKTDKKGSGTAGKDFDQIADDTTSKVVMKDYKETIQAGAEGLTNEIYEVGTFVTNNYKALAEARGMRVDEFIYGAMNFFDVNETRVEDLEDKVSVLQEMIRDMLPVFNDKQQIFDIYMKALTVLIMSGRPIQSNDVSELMKSAMEVSVCQL